MPSAGTPKGDVWMFLYNLSSQGGLEVKRERRQHSGKQQAGRRAGGRTHSSPLSSHDLVPAVNARSSCPGPPPWGSFTCSLARCFSLRPGQSQRYTWEKPFLISINFQISISLAVMTVGFWSCPGRMLCIFVSVWGAHDTSQLGRQRNLVFQNNRNFSWKAFSRAFRMAI